MSETRTPYWCETAPTIPRAWSSSNLGTVAKCPRAFQLGYIDGWRPKGSAAGLLYGILYHKCLEIYDKAGGGRDALRAAMRYAMDKGKVLNDLGDNARTSQTLTRAVIWYTLQFKDDPAKIVQSRDGKLAVEQYFSMELPILNPDGKPYLLHGYMDEFREFGGRRFVWERKTTAKAVSDWYLSQYNPNLQIDIYTIGGAVLEHEEFDGVMLDIHQTLVSGSRFKRHPVFRTQSQLEEALNDIASWIKTLEFHVERGYFPKNTSACQLCDFKEVCSKSVEVRQAFLESDFEQKKRTFVEKREGEQELQVVSGQAVA